MNGSYFLLDTSVLSEARCAEPVEEVVSFLRGLPRGAVAVPTWAIFELERGGQMLRLVNEERARPLLGWLDDLLETDIYVPPIGAEVHRLVARMSIVPELRRFWSASGGSQKMRFGSDPGIAAVAIEYGMPIATRDTRDFMLIHSHFPLPGLYDPFHERWLIDPASEWKSKFDRACADNETMVWS